MFKTVLFDLDGTLLPMDQDVFVAAYFKGMCKKLAPFGYEPKGLISAIWSGTECMMKNDGSRTNEEVFWEKFASIYGEKSLEHKPYMDEFYSKEFNDVKSVCGYNEKARATFDRLKEAGCTLALATSPIFPAVATENRMAWAGFCPEDFALFTSYENSRFCKPNPLYYAEVAEKLGVSPTDCLMIGNDATEDLAAKKVGMQVFLLTDCLINKDSIDISSVPHGDFDELDGFLFN